jgi:hypothetical protein
VTSAMSRKAREAFAKAFTLPVEAQAVRAAGVRRRNKHGAKKTTVDGIEFASKAEAKRWSELVAMEKAGEIRDLTRQPVCTLFQSGPVRISYTPDFRYQDGEIVVCEEVKGHRDTAYLLRRKMFVACRPHVSLREIRGGKVLEVYLTPKGLCRTRPLTGTPRSRNTKRNAV